MLSVPIFDRGYAQTLQGSIASAYFPKLARASVIWS